MGRYEDFIEAVRGRLGGIGVDEARAAVARTVSGLVRWLPRTERTELRDALPAPLRPAGIEDADEAHGDVIAFVAFVAGREGRPPERVRYEAQAVLSAFTAMAPEASDRIRRALPADFAELFVPPGQGPPPDLAAGAGVPPAELTDEDVLALLRRLPQWTGDRRRLSRRVAPPDFLAEQLFSRLHRLERSLNHRAVVVPEPDGGYHIEVWTHSEDLVTDLDAAFAQAVEDLIDDVLAERTPPASPPPPEQEIAPRRPAPQPVPGTGHRHDPHRDR